MSSSSSHATITYTSISSDMPSWAIPLMEAYESDPEAPKAAPQSPEQAPLLPILAPEYSEYLAPSDDDLPAEDQPLPADASPTALSPGYIADSEPEEESFEDKDREEEEEEEHLALADAALSIPDSVPSSEETEPFETDESAATPPSTPYCCYIYASAPTLPLPPPSPLTPLSFPLLLIPSPPLPLPSPDHRGAIPEAHMPPRKRIYFTTPSHRFEIKESSEAATTRQIGPTLARDVDYGFIDTLDASIRATNERVMTALEEVNERMIDLAATHRYDSKEFYTRHQDAHDDRALLQAHISTLERERQYFYSMSFSFAREHEHDRFRELERIRDAERQDGPADGGRSCVADALANYEGNKGNGNGHDSHGSGSGSGRTPNTTRNVGHDAAYGMPWKTLMKMLTDKYCPRSEIMKLEIELMLPEESDQVEKYDGGLPDTIQGSVMASKPKTMQEAIKFANDLMDQKIRSFAERQAYIAGPGEKKEYGGTLPLCTKCNYHHNGSCTAKCTNCKRIGHLAHDCRIPAAANTQRAPEEVQRVVTCFECGIQGHNKKDYPKLKNKNRGNQAGNDEAHTRAYSLGGNKANLDSNIVTGMFLLNNRYASVLFDTCANRSFVSTTFSSLIDIIPSTLDNSNDVELADDRITGVNTIIRGCTLNLLNLPFNINLMPVELGSFDVIIGMDWLSLYHVVMVCDEKIIRGDGNNPGNES
ncbi:putative reverse transcriptase domain-containing protein [Tanacetum coccineum]